MRALFSISDTSLSVSETKGSQPQASPVRSSPANRKEGRRGWGFGGGGNLGRWFLRPQASIPKHMNAIQKDQVIGHRLVKILAQDECDGGMDFCDCIMVLDSGLMFRLPAFPDEPFLPADTLFGALPIEDPRLKDVCGATIIDLLRPRLEELFHPGSVFMGLRGCPERFLGNLVIVMPGGDSGKLASPSRGRVVGASNAAN